MLLLCRYSPDGAAAKAGVRCGDRIMKVTYLPVSRKIYHVLVLSVFS